MFGYWMGANYTRIVQYCCLGMRLGVTSNRDALLCLEDLEIGLGSDMLCSLS